MDKVTSILQSLALDLAGPIRWADARALVMRTPEWHRDPELQRIEPIDLLTVYEDEVQRAEKELAEGRARIAEDKRRRGRKARDDYNVRPLSLASLGPCAHPEHTLTRRSLLAGSPRRARRLEGPHGRHALVGRVPARVARPAVPHAPRPPRLVVAARPVLGPRRRPRRRRRGAPRLPRGRREEAGRRGRRGDGGGRVQEGGRGR